MRKFVQATALAMLFAAATQATAATPAEFYSDQLQRGIVEFGAGRYDQAGRHLRIAAFGFVEAIRPYQTTQVYLTLTLDRLGQEDAAREAARKVLSAERIERTFASTALPAEIRSAFHNVAGRALTPQELALLLTQPAASEITARSTPPAVQTAPRTPPTRPAQPEPAPQQRVPTTTPASPEGKPGAQQQSSSGSSQKPPTTADVTAREEPPPARVVSAQNEPKPTCCEPRSPVAAAPRPSEPLPAPPPRPEETEPEPSETAQTQVSEPRPVEEPMDAPPPAPLANAPVQPSRRTATTLLAAGERALASSKPEARRLYREVLDNAGDDRVTFMRVAEGLYRARDFSGSLQVFARILPLRPGEEPYGYYIAVALYETGQHDQAKQQLAAAIPFIELTPDVVEYRTKIENPRD